MDVTSQILKRHGLSEADFLGEGIEARVYALGTNKVLRIVQRAELSSLTARSELCVEVAAYDFPFVTPAVLSIEELDGSYYTIEARFGGVSMRLFLIDANQADRNKVWKNYLDAVTEVSSIEKPDEPFGEVIARNPTRASTWCDYLLKRVDAETRASRYLAEDLPDAERRILALVERIREIPPCERRLVHGDIYPNNVHVDNDAQVTAIFDFSMLTVVGDPLMDIAAALYFPEIYDQITSTESTMLHSHAEKRFGVAAMRTIETYKLYYSAIFVGEKESDRLTYDWSIKNLLVL